MNEKDAECEEETETDMVMYSHNIEFYLYQEFISPEQVAPHEASAR